MMIERLSNAMAVPPVSDDPLADFEQAILSAEQRRDEQLAYIATLDPQGQAQVFARRVLYEIETTLRRSREHRDFIGDMFDGN